VPDRQRKKTRFNFSNISFTSSCTVSK